MVLKAKKAKYSFKKEKDPEIDKLTQAADKANQLFVEIQNL